MFKKPFIRKMKEQALNWAQNETMVVYFTIEIRIFRTTPFFFIHPVYIYVYVYVYICICICICIYICIYILSYFSERGRNYTNWERYQSITKWRSSGNFGILRKSCMQLRVFCVSFHYIVHIFTHSCLSLSYNLCILMFYLFLYRRDFLGC
jgi:hypothetical protein